jgi:hypothetical protein
LPKTGVSLHGLFTSTALCVIFVLLCVPRSQAQVFSADAVKAAFLYRFASYVEWPAEAHGSPFVIAVVDAENVASQLDQLLPRIRLNGQPAQVRRISRASELGGVHILYISPNAFTRSRALRSAAAKLPILLVTEDERGIESGAVINFVEAGRNVRFEVSLEASDRARLKIDSALLSVAARVERRPQAWAPCAPRCETRMASIEARIAR